jgi:excisionase family DNA binding protein
MYTPAQAAEMLGISAYAVTKLARAGKIPAINIGTSKRAHYRFREGDLIKAFSQTRQGGSSIDRLITVREAQHILGGTKYAVRKALKALEPHFKHPGEKPSKGNPYLYRHADVVALAQSTAAPGLLSPANVQAQSRGVRHDILRIEAKLDTVLAQMRQLLDLWS